MSRRPPKRGHLNHRRTRRRRKPPARTTCRFFSGLPVCTCGLPDLSRAAEAFASSPTDDGGGYRRTQARVPFVIGPWMDLLWCACVLLQRTQPPAGRVWPVPVHVTSAPLILQIGRRLGDPIAHACADARRTEAEPRDKTPDTRVCCRPGLLAPRTG